MPQVVDAISIPVIAAFKRGEVLGTRQTGLMEFRVAELPTHNHLLDEVEAISAVIRESHPALVEPLIQRWTGAGQQFAKV